MPKSLLATVMAIALIAGATLLPTASAGGNSGLCILCGERGLADLLLNVGLFAPLGSALAAAGRPLTWSMGLGGLLSLLIELAQVFLVAGRDANVGDLLANTVGTGAGWLLPRGLIASHRPATRLSAGLPSLLAAAAAALLLVGLWLMTPRIPDRPYYLQWTADLGHMETYDGEVLSSDIGELGLPGPPGRIGRSDSVRLLLRRGAPLRAVVLAGTPPRRLSPILGIYDDRQREVVMFGADGTDLVYRYRLLGQALRLDGGDIRFDGALDGVEPGMITAITVAPGHARYCVRVGERQLCEPGYSVGDTSMLLYYDADWARPLRTAVALGWLGVLFLPAGLAGRRRRPRAGAVAVVVLALTVAPPALGFGPTPLVEVLVAAAAILAGGLVARRVEWRAPAALR